MRTFYTAWLAVFVAWMGGDMVVHGVLLGEDYAKLPALFRSQTDAQPLFPLMILAHAVLAFSMVWIYRRGVRSGPWVGQGLRFGIAVALLTVVPTTMIYYAVQPTPLNLAVRQVLYGTLLNLFLGLVVAYFNRSTSWSRSKF
jgi:hypothetical protein